MLHVSLNEVITEITKKFKPYGDYTLRLQFFGKEAVQSREFCGLLILQQS